MRNVRRPRLRTKATSKLRCELIGNVVNIDEIRKALKAGRWVLTRHARERAGKRCIGVEALVSALAKGEVLEEYREDPRGPSVLLLGYDVNRPLHAVCALGQWYTAYCHCL